LVGRFSVEDTPNGDNDGHFYLNPNIWRISSYSQIVNRIPIESPD